MFKKELRLPILTLVLLSLGGLLLHVRIHKPADTAFNWIPVAFGLMSVIALPFLFNYRSTVSLAYLLNIVTVIAGAVAMAYYSVLELRSAWLNGVPITFVKVILESTCADILILLAKLPLGLLILRHFRPKTPS